MKTVKAFVAISLLGFIIMNLSEVSLAVTDALERCINIIIPSLFIMIVASRYIIANNILSPLEKLFKPLGYITSMSGRMTSAFIISNIGGYPIGASMLAQMVSNGQITKKDAEVAASYCFGSGPAFIIGAIGLCVYGSERIGYLMFISCITANLIACIIYNRIFKTQLQQNIPACKDAASYNITNAIIDSGKALFTMCSVIVAFSIVNVALNRMSMLTEEYTAFIAPLFEVTNTASKHLSALRFAPYVAASVAFGGLCVWLQNAALIGKNFSALRPLMLRIPISILTGAIFKVLNNRLSDDYMGANAELNSFVVNIDNFLPSICLIIMIFLLINKKRLAFLLDM